MIKIITPHPNTPPPSIKNALFILRPWTLEASSKGWKAHRDMIVHYRANPRPVAYMLARADEFIAAYAKDASIDLYVHKDIADEVAAKDHAWIRNILGDDELNKLTADQYDTVIFLYADAIGLGWNDFERRMLHLVSAQFIVINGRRRIFIWNAESRRKLDWRRFVAQAWWWEWLFAPWLLVISTFYALTDVFHLSGAKEAR